MASEETSALETVDPEELVMVYGLSKTSFGEAVTHLKTRLLFRLDSATVRGPLAKDLSADAEDIIVPETHSTHVYDFDALENLKQGIALDQRESEVLSEQTDMNLACIRELLGAQ